MTAPEHSPLPWGDDGFGIKDANGRAVTFYGDATAPHFAKEQEHRRLIIGAVNAHAALLAAAKLALAELAPIPFTEERHAIWLALKTAIAAAEERVTAEVTGGPSFGGR